MTTQMTPEDETPSGIIPSQGQAAPSYLCVESGTAELGGARRKRVVARGGGWG